MQARMAVSRKRDPSFDVDRPSLLIASPMISQLQKGARGLLAERALTNGFFPSAALQHLS